MVSFATTASTVSDAGHPYIEDQGVGVRDEGIGCLLLEQGLMIWGLRLLAVKDLATTDSISPPLTSLAPATQPVLSDAQVCIGVQGDGV